MQATRALPLLLLLLLCCWWPTAAGWADAEELDAKMDVPPPTDENGDSGGVGWAAAAAPQPSSTRRRSMVDYYHRVPFHSFPCPLRFFFFSFLLVNFFSFLFHLRVPTDSKLRRAPVQPRNLWTTITEHAQSKRRLSGRRNKSGRIYFFDTAKWDVGTQHSQLSSFFSLRKKAVGKNWNQKFPFFFSVCTFLDTLFASSIIYSVGRKLCDIVLNVWEGRTREREGGWL